eukprot:6490471-Amphidinium_carterae.1
MQRAWHSMKHFLLGHTGFKLRRLVFLSQVVGAALSGVDTFFSKHGLMTAAPFRTMQTQLLKWMRAMLRGTAKMGPAGHMVQLSSVEVLKRFDLGPLELEARIARLKLLQRSLAHKSDAVQFLAAVFGTYADQGSVFDDAGRVAHDANPWARQFQADVEALRCTEDGAHFLELHGNALWRVFTHGADDFIRLDVNALRSEFLLRPLPADATHDELEPILLHRCPCLRPDGGRCDYKCATVKQLRTHMSNTKGGTHGGVNLARVLTVINKCVLCNTVFSSIEAAKNHVQQSVRKGFCVAGRAHHDYELLRSKRMCCPICDEHFTQPYELHAHCAFHLLGIVPDCFPVHDGHVVRAKLVRGQARQKR